MSGSVLFMMQIIQLIKQDTNYLIVICLNIVIKFSILCQFPGANHSPIAK